MKFLQGVEKLWTGHEICTNAWTEGRTDTIPKSPYRYAVGDKKEKQVKILLVWQSYQISCLKMDFNP
jgi:hypothetical protein